MPRISVKKQFIYTALGKIFTDDEFSDALFDFGLEIDENNEDHFVIEIPANRYDLCSFNGLMRALKAYLSIETYKNLELLDSQYEVFVDDQPRYVACGIIEGIDLNENIYNDLINYQEILHKTFCRNRSLAAMGTHDLDKITFPVHFKISKKEDFNFKILNSKENLNGNEIEDYLKTDRKLSKYFKYLDKTPSLFFDKNNTILSYPPIINSDYSKITLNTKNIFVEVTGHNQKRVNEALLLILYSFRGNKNYRIKVNSNYSPQIRNKKMEITKEEVLKEIGLKMENEEIKTYLKKMMYTIEEEVINENMESKIIFSVPEIRFDVIHKCDIIEDICVAYGFNNFKRISPKVFTIGEELNINKACRKIKEEIISCGFLEVLTLNLVSNAENDLTGQGYVKLGNYKSLENESVKNCLMLTLLKSLSSNQHFPVPIKLFEIGDAVIIDENTDVGARNERRLCAIIAGNISGIEDIQGIITFLLTKLKKKVEYEETILKMYLDKRGGNILVDGEKIGEFGIICPRLIRYYKIPFAVSGFEINLEKLFF